MKNPTLPFTLGLAAVVAVGLIAGQAKSPKTPSSPPLPASHHILVHHAPGAATHPRSKFYRTQSPEGRKQAEAQAAHAAKLEKQARAFLAAGKLEEAEQVCREEIAFWQALNTTSGVSLQLLGDIQLAQGKYKDALATYAILRENSDDLQTSLTVALCYARLGDLEKARKALQACPWADLRKFADDPLPDDLKDMPGTKDLKSMEATLMLALAIITPDGYEQKLKYLQAADKLVPESWLITNRIGDTLYDLKRYNEAIPYYRREMQLSADKTPYHHRTRVEMYDLWQKQQKEKAPQNIKKAPK